LRIKEQETRLNLHEHDVDDVAKVSPLSCPVCPGASFLCGEATVFTDTIKWIPIHTYVYRPIGSLSPDQYRFLIFRDYSSARVGAQSVGYFAYDKRADSK